MPTGLSCDCIIKFIGGKMKRLNVTVKTTILSVLTVTVCALCIVATILGLVLSNRTMNSKMGLPDIKDCVLDFSGFDADNVYTKQHMTGTYEFFYNKWIVEDNYDGEPDAIVTVPHRYTDTIIGGKRLTNDGYASYRLTVKGLKPGTPVYFLNNNFIGACYGYVNGECVYKYGTRQKTGESRSNGEAEYTATYIVKDEKPLTVVFEVSSNMRGGLSSPPRLTISTTEISPSAPSFTNNIGFIVLGLVIALFIFSFLINFGMDRIKRDFSFSVVMFVMMILTVFSIAVYWRLLAFLRFNTYNIIMEVNFVADILLVFSLLYHFYKKGIIENYRVPTIVFGSVSIIAVVLYVVLMGRFVQAIAPMLTVACLISFTYPLAKTFPPKNYRNVLYGLFILSSAIFVTCTTFDLADITIAGMERSIAYVMLPVMLSVIILYRSISVENTLTVIKALKTEREHDAIIADSLKAQIKPHFVFNSLTNIQAAYEKDKAVGDKALTMFSKHLRANVDSSSVGVVPFSQELDNINNYIELENMRREKPITVLLDCMDDDFELPILSLQPFIENAFKYSQVENIPNGYIEIKTYETNKSYNVEINDNGVGFDEKSVKPTSVGLKNAKERLRLLSSATVTVDSKVNGGTRILISFPKNKDEK